jgi:heptosyltransferase II
MSDTAPQVGEASRWDDAQFILPPLPFRGRARRALADLICLLGMTVARAVRALGPERNAIVPQKILVVRRGGLGDVLMATPLLRGLREHFPSARLYVLASRQAVVGLHGCPWVDEILEVSSSTKDWLRLLQKLRKERIDTAFILHRFFAASLVPVLAGIPQRLGFSWKNNGFALTGSIPFTPARSQTLQIGQLLTLLGKPAADPSMEFMVNKRAIHSAREILAGWRFDPAKPVVGIHPGGGETAGSSDPAKRWLPERFGRLADLLIQNGGVQVVMLQGPGDEPFVDEALKNMRARVLGIASSLPLETFAALIGQCDLVVVNDTGPMHLAAAQKVPVVAIIGPTHPAYTLPRGEMHKVIWAGVPCSPCYHPEEYIFGTRQNGKKVFACWRATHECMTAVTAEDVYDVVIRQIRVVENRPLRNQTQSLVELNP